MYMISVNVIINRTWGKSHLINDGKYFDANSHFNCLLIKKHLQNSLNSNKINKRDTLTLLLLSITLFIIMQYVSSEVAFVISWWSTDQLINHWCQPRLFDVHEHIVFEADALARGRKGSPITRHCYWPQQHWFLPYKTIVNAIWINNYR